MKRFLTSFLLMMLTLSLLNGWLPNPASAWRGWFSDRSPSWSTTNPQVNLTHIFSGEINKRGKPVGYHARPGGMDPIGARVRAVNEGPNRAGVYEATVEIRTEDGQWLTKRSTFYPDRMTRDQVVEAVLNAHRHSTQKDSNRFSGPSGLGFTIQGYLLPDGRINTAFPVFKKD